VHRRRRRPRASTDCRSCRNYSSGIVLGRRRNPRVRRRVAQGVRHQTYTVFNFQRASTEKNNPLRAASGRPLRLPAPVPGTRRRPYRASSYVVSQSARIAETATGVKRREPRFLGDSRVPHDRLRAQRRPLSYHLDLGHVKPTRAPRLPAGAPPGHQPVGTFPRCRLSDTGKRTIPWAYAIVNIFSSTRVPSRDSRFPPHSPPHRDRENPLNYRHIRIAKKNSIVLTYLYLCVYVFAKPGLSAGGPRGAAPVRTRPHTTHLTVLSARTRRHASADCPA